MSFSHVETPIGDDTLAGPTEPHAVSRIRVSVEARSMCFTECVRVCVTNTSRFLQRKLHVVVYGVHGYVRFLTPRRKRRQRVWLHGPAPRQCTEPLTARSPSPPRLRFSSEAIAKKRGRVGNDVPLLPQEKKPRADEEYDAILVDGVAHAMDGGSYSPPR